MSGSPRPTRAVCSILALLAGCGAPAPAPRAPEPVAPSEAETAVAETAAPAPEVAIAEAPSPEAPMRWRDYACRAIGPWQPGPSLEAHGAPPDARSSDVIGWYAGGRSGRLFRWRARGAEMGELRWLRFEGGAWIESGSGAQRWPAHFDAEQHDTLVVAAPHLAILAHRGGEDHRFLEALWLVGETEGPRRIRFGRMSTIGGAIVTPEGEVHLHLAGFGYGGEQLIIHFAADGSEIVRRIVTIESDGETSRSLGVSVGGLLEASASGTRLHGYDPSAPSSEVSLVPRFVEPDMQLASGVAPCPASEGTRFAMRALGLDFATTDAMQVTYEVRGADTCVRSMRVPLYDPAGDLDCDYCDVLLDARSGALAGSALSSDGRIREVHCAAAAGSTEPHPLERMRAVPSP